MNEQNNCDKNELPEKWQWVELREVCDKVEVVKRKEKQDESRFLYLDIGGIDNHSNRIISHKEYTWKEAPSRAQQIIQEDDILFSTVRTYLKNIALVNSSLYNGEIASSGFTVLRVKKDKVISKYLFYCSISNVFLKPLNQLQTGSSYPAVRDKDVFSQGIPLPPLPEQQAIVSKIEELFSESDKGVEELKTAQQQLKVYRQAVLNSYIKQNELRTIESVILKLDQGWSPKCYNESSKDDNQWAVIKTTAIQKGSFLDQENKRLPENLVVRKQHELKAGDLLITRAGPK